MKKVGKIIRPFRYDLNQILYDYTVEVRNRFKGLDLIECLMKYGMRFVTLYRDRDQDHPHGKEMQKSKMAVWGSLSIFGCKKYNQSDIGVDHLVMSMCRVFSSVVGRECLL